LVSKVGVGVGRVEWVASALRLQPRPRSTAAFTPCIPLFVLSASDASADEAEEDSEGEGAPAGRQQQQPGSKQAKGSQQGGGKSPGSSGTKRGALDYGTAKSRFDLGILNPHALPQEEEEEDARGRGRGGRGGRGRGRGRDAGRGRGRGGRGGRKDDAAPRPPPGAFNPYALPDLNSLKAGKRSTVHVRSGNKSMSFRD
jgi:hypothetical protein